MTNQQSAEGSTANLEPAHSSGDAEALRRAVDELCTALESKVTVAWAELIKPREEFLDSLRRDVRAKQGHTHTADYLEFLEDRVTTITSQLYSLSLRDETFASLRSILANEVSDDLASRVELTAVSQALRRAIGTVLEEGRNRLESRSKSVLANLKKKKGMWLSLALLFDDTPGVWLAFCREDLEFVRNQGSVALMPAIMSAFDDHLARLQRVPNDAAQSQPTDPKD